MLPTAGKNPVILCYYKLGGASINWSEIKEEYTSGSMSQKELAKKHGVSASTLKSRAAKEGWYGEKKEKLKDSERSDEGGGVTVGLSGLSTLGDKLADKFAIAVDQLGKGNGEIDTNRLKQLVGVMKDLAGLAGETDVSENSEERQLELVEVIRNAVKRDEKGIAEKAVREDEA